MSSDLKRPLLDLREAPEPTFERQIVSPRYRQRSLTLDMSADAPIVRRRTVLHDAAEHYRAGDVKIDDLTPASRRRKLTFFEAVGPGTDRRLAEERIGKVKANGESFTPRTPSSKRSYRGMEEEEDEEEIAAESIVPVGVGGMEALSEEEEDEGSSSSSDDEAVVAGEPGKSITEKEEQRLMRRVTQTLRTAEGREALGGAASNGDLLDLFQAVSSPGGGGEKAEKGEKAQRRATINRQKELKKVADNSGGGKPGQRPPSSFPPPKPLPKKVEDDLFGKSRLGAAFILLREDWVLITFATIFSLGSTGLSLVSPQYSANVFNLLAEKNLTSFVTPANITSLNITMDEYYSNLTQHSAKFLAADSEFVRNILIIVALNAGSILLKAFTTLTFGLAGRRIAARVRLRLMASFLAKDAVFFDRRGAGELISRLNTDITQILGLTTAGASLLSNIAVLIGGSVAMFFTSWPLALIMFASLPIIAIATLFVGKLMRKWTVVILKAQAQQTQVANEILSTSRSTRLFEKYSLQMNGYTGALHELYRWSVKLIYASTVYGLVTSTVTVASQMVVLYIGGYLIFNPYFGLAEGVHTILTVGTLVAFQRYGTMVRSSVSGLSGLWTQILKAAAAAEIVIKLIEYSPDAPIERLMKGDKELHDYTKVPSTKAYASFLIYGMKSKRMQAMEKPAGEEGMVVKSEGIEFDNIFFRYPTRPAQAIFKSLSLHVKFDSVTAIVGPSGSGKSTLFNLLMRQYEPEMGEIRYGGVPLYNLELRWLRSQLSTVSQSPVIFSGTVAFNIAWGASTEVIPGDVDMKYAKVEMEKKKKKAKKGKNEARGGAGIPLSSPIDLEKGPGKDEDDEKKNMSLLGVPMSRIVEAAKKANAHSFIEKMPHGYHTVIGPRGTNLSGGQKQRIAIARAFLREAPILCLDEPTSALDPESEKAVSASINTLMEGKTVIMITHRLTTSQTADKIAVIAEGGLAEEGSHEQLMEAKGLYYTQYLSVTQK
uniref:ATP-dependent transporter ycf16 n=2 Tax=Palpitomonas bilix TaxID=652834 RepID=A0A7S3GGD7_9EUKA|mmetsp:Transcript_47969/g.124553  ORF Transcript_47969/g.124553 Transcript_47969/m.124553 type:complete len:998 (+) Transcript_47969:99-3092(+)